MDPNALLAVAVLAAPADLDVDRVGEPPIGRADAAAILAEHETPVRLTGAGLLATLGVAADPDLVGTRTEEQHELALVLARSLVERRDPDIPSVDGDVVEERVLLAFTGVAADEWTWTEPITEGAIERVGERGLVGDLGALGGVESLIGLSPVEVLAGVLGWDLAAMLAPVACRSRLIEHVDGPDTLLVTGDTTYPGDVDVVASSVQPLNWPLCNSQFLSMDVVDGSFQAQPEVALDGGITVSAYRCGYTEVVSLPGVAAGGPFWPSVAVTTRLTCDHWRSTRANAALEVGMRYDLAPGGDGTVVVDRGEAVVAQAGPGLVRVRSSKEIAFADPAAVHWFQFGWVREVFCILWNHLFDITVRACAHRSGPTQIKDMVQKRSGTLGPEPVLKSGAAATAGAKSGGPWLGAWLDDAQAYWDRSIGLMARECERLEQRRSASQPVTTQALFYDALETWEANRLSLRDGIELWMRLLGHGSAPTAGDGATAGNAPGTGPPTGGTPPTAGAGAAT